MASTSNSCISLFDQELSDLLRGIRIVGKDLFGHGSGNDDQIEPVSGERKHEKGKCYDRVMIV